MPSWRPGSMSMQTGMHLCHSLDHEKLCGHLHVNVGFEAWSGPNNDQSYPIQAGPQLDWLAHALAMDLSSPCGRVLVLSWHHQWHACLSQESSINLNAAQVIHLSTNSVNSTLVQSCHSTCARNSCVVNLCAGVPKNLRADSSHAIMDHWTPGQLSAD